jgi:hypothetical protein
VFHARDRWLRPGGVLIPSAATLEAVPVAAPTLRERHLDKWNEPHLGLDFGAGRRYAAHSIVFRDQHLRKMTALGAPTEVFVMDLQTAEYQALDASASLNVAHTGTCDGIAAWMRMRLSDEWLSTGPFDPRVHWSSALIPADPPIEVAAGDVVELRLQRPAWGDWAWRARFGTELRQGSTFFARPRGTAIAGLAEGRPVAGERGRAVASTLAAMDGSLTAAELATRVAADHPGLFPTPARARRFVQNLIRSHASIEGERG